MFKQTPLILTVALLMAGALTSGCASRDLSRSAQNAEIGAPEPDRARIVVYRESGPFGLNAIRPALYLDAQSLGPALPCAYRVIDIDPGEYVVSIGDPGHHQVTVTVGAGETAYVQALVSNGADLLQGAVRSTSVAEASARVPTLNRVAL